MYAMPFSYDPLSYDPFNYIMEREYQSFEINLPTESLAEEARRTSHTRALRRLRWTILSWLCNTCLRHEMESDAVPTHVAVCISLHIHGALKAETPCEQRHAITRYLFVKQLGCIPLLFDDAARDFVTNNNRCFFAAEHSLLTGRSRAGLFQGIATLAEKATRTLDPSRIRKSLWAVISRGARAGLVPCLSPNAEGPRITSAPECLRRPHWAKLAGLACARDGICGSAFCACIPFCKQHPKSQREAGHLA